MEKYIQGKREFLCQVCDRGPRGAHVLEFRARDTLMYRIGGGGEEGEGKKFHRGVIENV